MRILRLVYEWPEPWDGLTPGPYELTKAQQRLGHDIVVFCGGGFRELGTIEEDEGRLYQAHQNEPSRVTSVYKRGHSGARSSDDDAIESSFEKTRESFGSLEVFRFPRALRKLSLFLTTAPCVLLGYLWLKLTGQGPDIVHGHGHITACFNIYKVLFGWLDKTPYILHLHITAAGREARLMGPARGKTSGVSADPTPEVGESGRPSPEKNLDFWTRYWEWPIHKFSDWLGVRVADKVICVSSRVREEAVQYYGADTEKLEVVENGVNVAVFTPPSGDFAAGEAPGASFPQPQGLGNAAKSILYVGALQPRKNVHLLIDALAHLPQEYYLTIVGKGDKGYEESLRDMVKELNLEERVAFKGYIEYPKLPEIYQIASVFVLPSSYEGLPKVVLEALASGVPVLASGFEIEEKIKGLEFLESLEPGLISDKVQEIVAKGQKVAVEEIQKNYSWDAQAAQIEKIYQSLGVSSSKV
ncbi:MAG: glycosyltransferase family 4 protein [Patescibacteria group bacterium]|nr:glycosyltransferase family 4 protein [Patescibacteria group bacterium]